jgi:phosphoribosylaminoimidazole-succinocarboxamide synthase
VPEAAHLIRIGKTKEIHTATTPGHLVIRYRDTVLGTNGVIDPGANEVLLEIPEKGEKTCDAAVAFFGQCREAGVPTHFVRRLDARSILVRAAHRFPVEVVLRNFAYGSYLRRHPGTPPLAPLDGLIEFFVKDDAAGDPLIGRDEAVAAGLMPAAMVAPVIEWTRRVAALLGRDHEVVDFKVEFGMVDGALTLIDEVSADSLRLRAEGNVLDYPATLERLANAAAGKKPVLSP